VAGHYVAINGAGNIYAGVKKDANGNLIKDASGKYVLDASSTGSAGTFVKSLALSLASGGWTVNAAQNILLQEVRNPNGLFNDVGAGSSTTKHEFTYAPDAYVTLNSGNSVQLLGESLPRYNDFEKGITPIYAGTLSINTGAGGVILGNHVTLAPSATGNLTITTTGGGSLQTKAYADYLVALADYHLHQNDTPAPKQPLPPADQWQLLVSDSGKTQYKQAGDIGLADHAAVPLHLNDSLPIQLNISGGLNGIILGVPKLAEINVVGDMVNSRLDGQNLHDADVTSINVGQVAKLNLEHSGVLDAATDGSLPVGGNIINRNEFTTVVLNTAPDLTVFDLVYPPLNNSLAGLGNQFYTKAVTDPITHQTTYELTFQGRMTGDQLDALLNLRVRAFDANGLPLLDATGQPVTEPAQFTSTAAINQLYAACQDVPLNPDTGYRLGGGGTFNINANNLDLGSTIGIVSQGPRGNTALANYFTHGADVNVNLTGNLEMFSTKIASLNGGNLTVKVGGYANIGSRTFQSSDAAARGIFTSAKSDVTVIADGDININGSRIAAFDGGNVTVRSLHGNVDAGTGSGGAATVENIYVDPVRRKIVTYLPTIPGSGILATTFPPSLDPAFPKSVNAVGNILVETPNGNIIASAGGIVQLPLNKNESLTSLVELLAGYALRDKAGSSVDAAHIADGTAVLVSADRNIDASGSGVIGQNIVLKATGEIKGNIFSVGSINLDSTRINDVVALGKDVTAKADSFGPTVTIIGTESVNAAGADPSQIFSQNANGGGSTFAQGTVANSTSTAAAATTDAEQAVKKSGDTEDDANKKGKGGITVAQKVSRVTVILPPKS
jgi:hypothetical protein